MWCQQTHKSGRVLRRTHRPRLSHVDPFSGWLKHLKHAYDGETSVFHVGSIKIWMFNWIISELFLISSYIIHYSMIFSHLFNGYLWNHLTFPWEKCEFSSRRLRWAAASLHPAVFLVQPSNVAGEHWTKCRKGISMAGENWDQTLQNCWNLYSNSPAIWKNADLSIHQDANQQLFRIDPAKAGESSKKIEGIASKNGKITRHPRKNICWCKLQDVFSIEHPLSGNLILTHVCQNPAFLAAFVGSVV